MTPSHVAIEKAANDLALEIVQDAGSHKSSIYWQSKALALVDAVLLEAEKACEDRWKNEPNKIQQNIFSHGCIVSARAIRALRGGRVEEQEKAR